jgi:hypothetical protein
MSVGAGTSVDPHDVRIGDDGEGGRCSDEVTVLVMPGLPSAGCAGSKDVRVDDEGRGEGYYYNEAVALDRPVLFSMESAVLRDVGDSDEGGCCDKAVAHYRPVLPSIEEEMEGVCERVSPVVVGSGAAGAAGASLRRRVL